MSNFDTNCKKIQKTKKDYFMNVQKVNSDIVKAFKQNADTRQRRITEVEKVLQSGYLSKEEFANLFLDSDGDYKSTADLEKGLTLIREDEFAEKDYQLL